LAGYPECSLLPYFLIKAGDINYISYFLNLTLLVEAVAVLWFSIVCQTTDREKFGILGHSV